MYSPSWLHAHQISHPTDSHFFKNLSKTTLLLHQTSAENPADSFRSTESARSLESRWKGVGENLRDRGL